MLWTREDLTNLRLHLPFPSTGKEIIDATQNIPDITSEQKEDIRRKIREEIIYNNADQLSEELGG